MGESGLVHGDNGDQGDPGDDFQPLIERLTAPPPHQAAGGDGQQRLSRVHLGNNIHGGDLAVPAGQTWQISGDVKIEGDAMLKIEDGATLQVNGHQATSGGQGHHQWLSQVRTQKKETPDVLGALLSSPEPERPRITLRIPAEGDPVAVERMRERVLQELDEAASGSLPLSARQEFAAQLRAEAERQMLSNALLTPVGVHEYLSTLDDHIRQALDSSALSAALAAQAAMQQALNPMALSMIEAVREMMSEHSRQMAAAMATIGAQPFAELNMARHALSDLDTVRNALRRGGYSLGLLDDVDQALSRRDEQRRAATKYHVQGVLLRLSPQPQPPAERVQVVHLAPGDWQEALTHALTSGQASPADVGAFLYSFSTGQRQAGLYPPEWPVIAAVVALYKEHGANLQTQQNFVSWLIDSAKGRALGLGSISLSTFQRYLATWEQNTGEQVRPGKGRRKRGAQL